MVTQENTLDEINRRVWRSTVKFYKKLHGWTDPGERAALRHIAAEMHSRPILDIGVGAGRTTPLLQAISHDYIGIDYTQAMIDAAQHKYPQTCYLLMDARDLSGFNDNQFALVMFSFNGIDTVNLIDRQRVLREVHRVLQPNGVFLLSAHNRNGPGCGERPGLRYSLTRNPLKRGWQVLKSAWSLPTAVRNHRRYRAFNELHDEWALMNCAAHDFGAVIIYTALAEQKRQLTAAGFVTEVVFGNTRGEVITETTPTDNIWWLHYVARKMCG